MSLDAIMTVIDSSLSRHWLRSLRCHSRSGAGLPAASGSTLELADGEYERTAQGQDASRARGGSFFFFF